MFSLSLSIVLHIEKWIETSSFVRGKEKGAKHSTREITREGIADQSWKRIIQYGRIWGKKGTHIKHPLFRQPSIFGLVPAAFFFSFPVSLFLCVYVLAMPEKKKEKRMGTANRDLKKKKVLYYLRPRVFRRLFECWRIWDRRRMWTRRVDQQKGLCPRAFERIGPGGRDAIEVLSLTTTLLCCLMLYPVVGKIINKDVKKMRFHSGMFFQAAPLHTQKKISVRQSIQLRMVVERRKTS